MLTIFLAMLAGQAVHRINQVQTVNGTIAAANVSQQVFAPDADRSYLMCQNPIAATGPLLVDFGRAAGSGSIELAPGGSVTFAARAVPTMQVTVASATVGARFICKTGSN